MSTPGEALERAYMAAGGRGKLAEALGITAQAISQWDRCPPLRVRAVADLTGIPDHELRPDLYAAPKEGAAA